MPEEDTINNGGDHGTEDNNLPSITADLVEGVCTGMEKVCMGTDGWAEPEYGQLPPYEAEEASCDNLDNDCDGLTDEEREAMKALEGDLGLSPDEDDGLTDEEREAMKALQGDLGLEQEEDDGLTDEEREAMKALEMGMGEEEEDDPVEPDDL